MLKTADYLTSLIHDENELPFFKFRVCDYDHLNILVIDLLKTINLLSMAGTILPKEQEGTLELVHNLSYIAMRLAITDEFEYLDKISDEIRA